MKKFGYEAFNEHSADKLVSAFYAVDFMQTFIIYVSFSQEFFVEKFKNSFKTLFDPCFKYPWCTRKAATLETKIY